MLITFEGGEGTGKTTLIEKLKTYLLNKKVSLVVTREPGGSLIAEQIRNVLLDPKNKLITKRTEALLYAASRAQHIDEVIKPSLEDGKIVICDRYLDSSLAYQGYARELGFEYIYKINHYALNYLPDLTFYIDLDPEIGQQRVQTNRRGKIDRLDMETIHFHQKVREGYLEIAKLEEKRIHVIDGNQPIEVILEEILNKVDEVIWKT